MATHASLLLECLIPEAGCPCRKFNEDYKADEDDRCMSPAYDFDSEQHQKHEQYSKHGSKVLQVLGMGEVCLWEAENQDSKSLLKVLLLPVTHIAHSASPDNSVKQGESKLALMAATSSSFINMWVVSKKKLVVRYQRRMHGCNQCSNHSHNNVAIIVKKELNAKREAYEIRACLKDLSNIAFEVADWPRCAYPHCECCTLVLFVFNLKIE